MLALFFLWQSNIVYLLVLAKSHHLILFITTFGVVINILHFLVHIISLLLFMITRASLGFFLMKHKDEAQPLIKRFFSYVSTQFESHIKKFRSDNGGEFLSLQSFFKDNGVLFQHSCVYTPQQNGVVERKHRHIL